MRRWSLLACAALALGSGVAPAAIALWVGVIACGRLIAYF
jgi:hypothetical protein